MFAASGGETVLHKHLDGKAVGTQDLGLIDGRWSLNSDADTSPYFLILTDDSGETSSGLLGSLMFASRAFGADEIAALGGPDAAGILDGPCQASCRVPFRRGDANGDGGVDIGDAVFVIFHLFTGGPAPGCRKSLDADDNGALEISDPIRILYSLFGDSPPPAEPTAKCAADPTPDALDCASFNGCR